MNEGEEERNELRESYRIKVGDVMRLLPIRRISPTIKMAIFSMLDDWELTEVVGLTLAEKIPRGVEVLVMPSGNTQALLHVMGRKSSLLTILVQNERSLCVSEPVVFVNSKTENHALFLGGDDTRILFGKHVAIINDVVSNGEMVETMKDLLHKVGVASVVVMAAFTQGKINPDVITLGHIPLF